MKTVKVKQVCIGEGMPCICVPLVGKNKAELAVELKAVQEIKPDIVEWRMDFLDAVDDWEAVKRQGADLAAALPDTPILATFRTKREGGAKAISEAAYYALNRMIAENKLADLLDVELFCAEETVRSLIACAHAHDIKIVLSNHDFVQTPSYAQLIERAKRMRQYDADLLKLAVMPRCRQDVLTLLQATSDLKEQIPQPLITMAMGKLGVISRLCGETFGSAITFASAKTASAPGQLDARKLKQILETLHQAVQ